MFLSRQQQTQCLEELRKSEGRLHFPGRTSGTPLSNMALLMLLGRMNCGDITAHGFRSTFRDWAADQTSFPNEVVEMALAHAIESKTEAAYRRSDLFEKRRSLMAAWADFCGKAGSPIQKKVLMFRDYEIGPVGVFRLRI